MEEVDRLIIHALEQVGVSCLSSSSSSSPSVSSLRDFSVEDVVEGVSRCLMAIDPALSLPLKIPPSMAARYRIGTELANAVRSVGFPRQVGYQTFMYLNENDLRDLFVFLVEALPKEKMDDVGEEIGGGGSGGGVGGSGKGESKAALEAALIRRKCVEAVAAALKAGSAAKSSPRGVVEDQILLQPVAYEDYETIDLKIPRYRLWSKSVDESDDGLELRKRMISEYHNEILPWAWEQTGKQSVLLASLMERNSRSIVAEKWSKKIGSSTSSADFNVGEMLKAAIAEAKTTLANEIIVTSPSSHKLTSLSSKKETSQSGAKPAKPAKPSKLTKPKLEDDEKAEESDGNAQAEDAAAAAAAAAPSESVAEKAAKEREATLAKLEEEVASMRSSLERLKEEILSLHESNVQKGESISALALQKAEVESKMVDWDKISALLPDAEENANKLEIRLANAQQKMVKLQEEWNAVRLPLEEEIRVASAKEDVKSGVVAELTERLAQTSEKCQKLRDDVAEKDARMQIVGKQLDAAFPKGLGEDEEEKRKAVSRNSFTKRILEIVNNIKKQKAELDKIIADTKELSKTVNSLEGKLDRSFSLADELVFKNAKKDEAVRKAYKLLAALHETCGALIGVVDEIGASVRGTRDKEDETEREEQLEMEANLNKITIDLDSMTKENAALGGKK